MSPLPLTAPAVAVQAAVVDGFAEVGDVDALVAGKVGDGARHLQDAVIGASAESETVHGSFHQVLAVFVDVAPLAEQLLVHLCVAVDALIVLVALFLNLAGGDDALTDDGAGLAEFLVGKGGVGQGSDFDVQVSTSMDYRGQHFYIEYFF